jgi:hypothetical protein
MSLVSVKLSIPGQAVEEFHSSESPSLPDFEGKHDHGALPVVTASPVAQALLEAKQHCDTVLSALLQVSYQLARTHSC